MVGWLEPANNSYPIFFYTDDFIIPNRYKTEHVEDIQGLLSTIQLSWDPDHIRPSMVILYQNPLENNEHYYITVE